MSGELSPMAKGLLIAAAFVVVVAGLKAAETVLVPFLLSVFIALIFSPLLAWLKERRVPNVVAICLIIALVVLIGWLIGILVGSSISDFRKNLPAYQEGLQQLSGGLLTWLGEHGVKLDMEQMRNSFDPGKIMQLAGNTLSSLGNAMTNAFLILLTVIFILAEQVGFSEKLQLARKDNGVSRDTMQKFTDSVNSYLGIKSLLSLLTGVLVMVWLWILGLDYPVMWGLLAFLLNFVPNIGSIIAAVPPVLLALVQLNPLFAGLTALGFVVVNVLVGNFLEPRIMGRGLNLSPLVVFLSLVFWGWVLGPVGMLLSIPLTIMVKIALENDPDTRWMGVMLGSGEGAPVLTKAEEQLSKETADNKVSTDTEDKQD